MRYQLFIRGRHGYIYVNGGSTNMRNESMILAERKFWQTELAVKLKSIFTVRKWKACASVRKE